MDVREKLVELLQDANNAVWRSGFRLRIGCRKLM